MFNKNHQAADEPQLDMSRIPAHVAIIMDGNGRWAQARYLPRVAGHKQGMQTVKKVTIAASDLGVKVLSLYAFSTENWKRSAEEVGAIMDLLRFYLKNYFKKFVKDNIRMHVIGEKSRLDTDIQKAIAEIEDLSREKASCEMAVVQRMVCSLKRIFRNAALVLGRLASFSSARENTSLMLFGSLFPLIA